MTLETTKRAAAAAFASGVLVSVTAAEAGLFLLAAAMAFEARREKFSVLTRAAGGQPLFRFWMLYLAAGAVSAVFAFDRTTAFRYLPSDLIKYFCFSVLMFSLKDRLLDTASEFYTAGAVFAAAAGIAQVGWFFGNYGTFYPRAGAFSNPVRYGEILVLAFAFVLSVLLRPKEKEHPGFGKYYAAAAVLLFAAILLARTRGAYLGLLMVFASLFLADAPSRRRLAALAALFIGLGALMAAFNPYLRGRLSNPYAARPGVPAAAAAQAPETAANADSVGVNIRLELWKLGIKISRDNPLLGVGPGNVKKVFRRYHPGPLGPQEIWSSLHNLYLHQLAERGLAGLAALLALFGGMFALAARNFRGAPCAYTLWAVAALPAYFVMNLTEVSFQHIHTSFAVFLALAASTNSRSIK